LILLLLAMLSAQAADVGAMYWLTRWSRKHDPPNNRDVKDGLYFGVYTAISALQIILSASSQLLLFGGSLHASKSSHLRLLSTVLHATYEWIVKTPSGQIMNRFSSDMFSLDNILIDLLRPVLENYLSIGFRFAAISSFVPTFLVPVLICLGLGVYIGRLYLFGSTAAKRIYAASISPLLSDVSEAVSGIEVIRSFKQEAAFEDNFLSKLANYIRAWEAVSDCQRWLAVRMDILAGLISFSAAILAYMSTKDSPAVVGFSLTSSTILCTSLLCKLHTAPFSIRR
jgi:ABC-type multidrug transport system fused ATPase/permease subunit